MEKIIFAKDKLAELKKDVEIIKPYLISKGYDFNFYANKGLISFGICKKDNIRLLVFGMNEDPSYMVSGEEFGQIVYDTDGNILLDCLDKRNDDCWFHGYKKEDYYEICPDGIFIDDLLIISNYKYQDDHEYSIYELKDGKYNLIKEEVDAKLLKTSGDDYFLYEDWFKDNAKIYNIKQRKYLDIPQFNFICGTEYDIYNMNFNNRNYKMNEKINEIILNNNVLFVYNVVSSEKYTYADHADAFLFIDTNGNIVSKLCFKTEDDFATFDINKETYDQVMNQCVDRIDKAYKKKIANEKRRETIKYNRRAKITNELLDTLSNNYIDDNEQGQFIKKI